MKEITYFFTTDEDKNIIVDSDDYKDDFYVHAMVDDNIDLKNEIDRVIEEHIKDNIDRHFKNNGFKVKSYTFDDKENVGSFIIEIDTVDDMNEKLSINEMDEDETFEEYSFTISDLIRNGQTEGSDPFWTLSHVYVNSYELEEFCGVFQDMILDQIAEAICNGSREDSNFSITIDCERLREEDEWTEEIKKDLEEKFWLSEEQIADILNPETEDKEYTFNASYTISVEPEEDEDIKYIDEWQILYKSINDQDEYFEEDEAGAYDRFEEVKPKVKQFIKKTYKIINNDFDYPEEEDVEIIYDDNYNVNESIFDDKCKVIKGILGDDYELKSVNYGKQAGYKQINYSPKGEYYTYSVDGKDWNEVITKLKKKIGVNESKQNKVVVTRCNNCMTYYPEDIDICKKCGTDAFLMDMTEDDLKEQKIDKTSIKIEESLTDDTYKFIVPSEIAYYLQYGDEVEISDEDKRKADKYQQMGDIEFVYDELTDEMTDDFGFANNATTIIIHPRRK